MANEASPMSVEEATAGIANEARMPGIQIRLTKVSSSIDNSRGSSQRAVTFRRTMYAQPYAASVVDLMNPDGLFSNSTLGAIKT